MQRLTTLLGGITFLLLLATLNPCSAEENKKPVLPAGECDIVSDGNAPSPCVSSTNGAVDGSTSYVAVRSNSGVASIPIDIGGRCRYLDNNGTQSFFVPFKSDLEWMSFLSGHPTDVTITSCARPASLPIPADYPTYPNGIANPFYVAPLACDSPQVWNITLPYQREGTLYSVGPGTVSFQCTVKGLCDDTQTPPVCGQDQQWVQTAIAKFDAEADNDAPLTPLPSGGWMLASVTYSGNPPVPNPPCGVSALTYSVSAIFSGPDAVGSGPGNSLVAGDVTISFIPQLLTTVGPLPSNVSLGQIQTSAPAVGVFTGGTFTGDTITLTITQVNPVPGGSVSLSSPVDGYLGPYGVGSTVTLNFNPSYAISSNQPVTYTPTPNSYPLPPPCAGLTTTPLQAQAATMCGM